MNDIVSKDNQISEVSHCLELAKNDRRELGSLVRDYTPFIKKCVSAVMFRVQSKEDNLTEAMLAFAHAVQTYKAESGSFVAYAKMVIRNRLIDIARSELSSTQLLSQMLEKKQLPSAKLMERFPKKAVEKYRLYIIALVLIQKGDYPYVYSFVPQFLLEEEMR